MKKLNFKIKINAPAKKVWQVLWNDSTYRQWTSAFMEGSYAVSDWKEGSKILFLGPGGGGMYSIIAENKPNQYMAFKHLGEVKNFAEQPDTDESKSWSGSMETYSLKEENEMTTLETTLDATEQFQEYFQTTFPKAMALLKQLAEQPVKITIEATIAATVEKVWKFWSAPEHIRKWCNASDDWHAPKAENDLRTGGKFLTRMEAKDGSFGFDFGGVYDEVKTNKRIAYTMGDGRKADAIFTTEGNTTKVVETFEAESENSFDMQRGGWQAILNNFKKYTESN
jgi:uncharacterized protein YndB with AHSA1/START domain